MKHRERVDFIPALYQNNHKQFNAHIQAGNPSFEMMSLLSRLTALSSTFLFFAGIQSLPAGTIGNFTYEDTGTAITITEHSRFATGDVSIPETIDGKPVTTIGERAFYNNSNLISIHIPPSVKSIGKEAFGICRKLKRINIPAEITAIEDNTFSTCIDLESIALPDEVQRIGIGAFSSCQKLKDFKIPASLTTISSQTFSGCQGLKKIVIPPGVKAIDKAAFISCGLESIIIPSSVTSVGDSAFDFCAQLKKVRINAPLKEINKGVFRYCRSLSEVNLPESVRIIEDSAFEECNLSTVTLPKAVEGIGQWAFRNCKVLQSAVYQGNAPIMGKGVFDGAAAGFTIFVENNAKGFSIPKWLGYGVSPPKGEIALQGPSGEAITNEQFTAKFGSVFLKQKGSPSIFTVRNVGNRKLTGISTGISGRGRNDFSLRPSLKRTLSPGQSIAVELIFSPKEPGQRKASLEIFSSDLNEDPFLIRLSGVGLVPFK